MHQRMGEGGVGVSNLGWIRKLGSRPYLTPACTSASNSAPREMMVVQKPRWIISRNLILLSTQCIVMKVLIFHRCSNCQQCRCLTSYFDWGRWLNQLFSPTLIDWADYKLGKHFAISHREIGGCDTAGKSPRVQSSRRSQMTRGLETRRFQLWVSSATQVCTDSR